MADPDESDMDLNVPMEMENGHITQSSEENSDADVETSDEYEQLMNATGEYDRDLPTSHGYLGTLNPLSGYTIFEDGAVLHIIAIYTSTLVFPGFTLPLVMSNHYENRVMQTFINENNKVFVLLCANSGYNGLFEFGITMEIFETSIKNNVLHIKAKGRQRSEPPIVPPLSDTQLLTLKGRRQWKLNDFNDLKKIHKYRRYHLAQYPNPGWIYDHNEVSFFMNTLREGLKSYGDEYIPSDPEKFSYWFVQNYQLSVMERLRILELKTTLERLKLECIYLKLERKMCCNICESEITDPDKVFAMSKDGWVGNYVNPGGQVYETVTVLEARNFNLVGTASRNFSWFPGYSWTIMQCSSCNNHLGWKFGSNNLTPREFYGLAKSGFKVVIPEKPRPPDLEELQSARITYAFDYIGLY
ncbi:protein cereblon isoform X2 [Cylas formicarius]|uniref:protein cereblon isoform X2 n=1 Tax=Cylas formicarius TaxID=197179 RepID=UPI002958DD20|nr:protein cereblon isoform X2 [Cylas formicarius]